MDAQPLLSNPHTSLHTSIHNKTAVGISTDAMNRKQTQHLIRDFNIINEYIATNKLRIQWVSTKEKLADIMTKSLGHVKVTQFTNNVNWQ
ncbi:hypothetical protein O181_112434 [Austropuccinia psidii MF-1]|uniref:Uncharacterized protein n=1 Tax=Austropuccinia psidii MF-1 TaxID=1389203 RepID=A0A9Q3PSR2_9BASI|nr:hypothetical protein [Austropuccinia psidii MF-1]